MNDTARRVNAIIGHLDAAWYLEIGVFAGETFLDVAAPFKAAVDPLFQFDPTPHERDGVSFFPMTSDAFFSSLSRFPAAQMLRGDAALPVFDVIYIDGLHTFTQSYRDFINSLRFAHEKTVWIFDDTIPNDPYSALPDPGHCLAFRELAGIEEASWHGDVYKTVVAIHDAHPEFFFRTLVGSGNPQTVVWRAPGCTSTRTPLCADFAAIDQLSYFDMAQNAAVLQIGKEDDLLEILHTPTEGGLTGTLATATFFYQKNIQAKAVAFLAAENKRLRRRIDLLEKELDRRKV